MKIRPLTAENSDKVSALLSQAFPNSRYEDRLVHNLRKNGRKTYEWVCIHKNMFIAYIAFSTAYNGDTPCGFHLAPVAVNPQYQNQGVGSELIRFALRQKELRDTTIYVLGDPAYYQRFGFAPVDQPVCPFARKKDHFMAKGEKVTEEFTIGYEPEFLNS
ncbi:GNAT family N-acetyltransferase [Desulfosediminicola sp.]|uniref:GNAT family N-acetyltransferase n=1 Tax=Desulfosediminicola sp. TaxID=2886825 RepID=UPI003AF22D0A